MINRNDIRTGVETRKDPWPEFGTTEPEEYQIAWASLHWRGETRITDDMDAQREEYMKDPIYRKLMGVAP